MREPRFNIYVCGMSKETFTEQIMIYRPIQTTTKIFSEEFLDKLNITHVGELIEHIKQDHAMRKVLGEWGLENINLETIYVRHQDYLLGLLEDKALSDIYDYFHAESLELAYFIVGGASNHNDTSYRFTVHPNEDIHRHMPMSMWQKMILR